MPIVLRLLVASMANISITERKYSEAFTMPHQRARRRHMIIGIMMVRCGLTRGEDRGD